MSHIDFAEFPAEEVALTLSSGPACVWRYGHSMQDQKRRERTRAIRRIWATLTSLVMITVGAVLYFTTTDEDTAFWVRGIYSGLALGGVSGLLVLILNSPRWAQPRR